MTKSNLNKICAAIGAIALTTSTLSAGTFTVTTTADSGTGSLRQAILNANAHGGGDIIFSRVSGTIALQCPLPVITQNTFILGPSTCTVTVSGSHNFPIFSINAGVSAMISSLTIADGSASGCLGVVSTPALASGIANAGQLEVRNCVIQDCMNFFSLGGAVYNSGTLQMNNCVVTDSGSATEDAQVNGGGVYNSGCLTIRNSTISNCSATQGGGIFNIGNSEIITSTITSCLNDSEDGNGGGIYNGAGSFVLERSSVTDCQGGFDGGGIFTLADITVRKTTISGNNAFEGGGMFLRGGTNFLHNCMVSSNEDFGFGGGGIKNLNILTITHTTVNGNFSFFGGGGIENLGQIEMTNCTVSGNGCSTTDGGGILNTTVDADGTSFLSTLVQMMDCTVVSNRAAGPKAVGGIENNGGVFQMGSSILADDTGEDFSGVLGSLGYNLILNTSGTGITGVVTGNIYGREPLLGPLQHNGGHTFTHALLTGSPAIDAGPVGGVPHVDQRGVPRPQGTADDIGAFEVINHHVHFVSLTSTAGGMQVGLKGIPGLDYTIQRATSLNGPWTTLTNITAGTDGCGACMDACSSTGTAFYRSVFP